MVTKKIIYVGFILLFGCLYYSFSFVYAVPKDNEQEYEDKYPEKTFSNAICQDIGKYKVIKKFTLDKWNVDSKYLFVEKHNKFVTEVWYKKNKTTIVLRVFESKKDHPLFFQKFRVMITGTQRGGFALVKEKDNVLYKVGHFETEIYAWVSGNKYIFLINPDDSIPSELLWTYLGKYPSSLNEYDLSLSKDWWYWLEPFMDAHIEYLHKLVLQKADEHVIERLLKIVSRKYRLYPVDQFNISGVIKKSEFIYEYHIKNKDFYTPCSSIFNVFYSCDIAMGMGNKSRKFITSKTEMHRTISKYLNCSLLESQKKSFTKEQERKQLEIMGKKMEEILKYLDFKYPDKKAEINLLLKYASENKLNDLQEYIKKVKNINKQDKTGWTALHYASFKNYFDVVKLLLSNKANPNIQDKYGMSPLHYAAQEGCNETIRLLIENGANINLLDKRKWTPIFHSLWENHPETAMLFVKNKCQLNIKDDLGNTPLIFSAEHTKSPEIIDMLIKNGADVKARHVRGWTALHEANCKEVAEVLIKHGADVNAVEENGITPLHRASWCGLSGVVEVLLNNNADVNSVDKLKRSALWWASSNGRLKLCKYLLEKGANPNLKADSQYGMQPIHWGALGLDLNMIKLLKSYKADLYAKDKYGKTPLESVKEHKESYKRIGSSNKLKQCDEIIEFLIKNNQNSKN